jgi:hypothetical protein
MQVDNTDNQIESTNIEKAVFEHFRVLPFAQQQEVLDFVEFLTHKLTRKTSNL